MFVRIITPPPGPYSVYGSAGDVGVEGWGGGSFELAIAMQLPMLPCL